jgi:hypothetical protein
VVQRRTDELLLDYGVEATDTWWPLGRAKVGYSYCKMGLASQSTDCPQQRTVRVGLSGHRDFAAGHLRSGLSQRSVAGTNWRRLIDSEYIRLRPNRQVTDSTVPGVFKFETTFEKEQPPIPPTHTRTHAHITHTLAHARACTHTHPCPFPVHFPVPS